MARIYFVETGDDGMSMTEAEKLAYSAAKEAYSARQGTGPNWLDLPRSERLSMYRAALLAALETNNG